jgi:hypothetical protein
MSAAVSPGLCLLWDTDAGLSPVNKYTYSSEEHIKVSALFTTGRLNTGNPTNSTSTSSVTSVPKPLKFLRPHYPDLQSLYETWPPSEDKVSGKFESYYGLF